MILFIKVYAEKIDKMYAKRDKIIFNILCLVIFVIQLTELSQICYFRGK